MTCRRFTGSCATGPGLVSACLAALFLAACAYAKLQPGRTDPRTAIILAERIVEHNPSWSPTSVYCERPRTLAYDTKDVADGIQHKYTCQWVRQGNPLLPYEIDTVAIVYDRHGRYLFSLVSTTYPPAGGRASCRIELTKGGYHTSCHKAG